MAELATLARPYANAVFDIAKGDRELPQWSRILSYLSVAATQDQVGAMLAAPDVSAEQKAFKLIEICGAEMNDRGRKFVQVLAQNKRLDLIPEVLKQFEDLRALEEQSLDVEITSAVEMSDAEKGNMKSALQRKFNKDIELTCVVDATLLGGALIKAGDTVIDGSLRGKLNKLAESLNKT